jgi:ABC-type Fe3+-hydroxamate transport system substrate-binding protein
MPAFTDQINRTIHLPRIPRRIISLVPSQTELLYSLGLEDAVVGITKFCVHPESWFRNKPRIGGTKAVDPVRVDALRPDLIIANKEENDRFQVEALAARYPVWISNVTDLPDALAMIRDVGLITGKSAAAEALANAIAKEFASLPGARPSSLGAATTQLSSPAVTSPELSAPRIAYLIWRNPWMAAGGDTFINNMLEYCGFVNAFASRDRYPVVDLSSLAGPGCPSIFLSSEPYPFRQRHVDEIREVLPDADIQLVDGEFFSWYGSRLLEAPAYFRQRISCT